MSTIQDILEPTGGNLLIRRDNLEVNLSEGLVAPDTAKSAQQPTSGKVLKRGPAAPEEFAPGTRVLFGKYAGNEVALEEGGESVHILHSSEVRGFLPEGEA